MNKKTHARMLADGVTAYMRKHDEREDGRDVVYRAVESQTARLCPQCQQMTLYPVTWMEEIGNKNRLLVHGCISCNHILFEAHPENGIPYPYVPKGSAQ